MRVACRRAQRLQHNASHALCATFLRGNGRCQFAHRNATAAAPSCPAVQVPRPSEAAAAGFADPGQPHRSGVTHSQPRHVSASQYNQLGVEATLCSAVHTVQLCIGALRMHESNPVSDCSL